MKYKIPDELKRYHFTCNKTQNFLSFGGCKHRCPDTYRECWEHHSKKDLAQDCDIENERKARKYVTYSKCGSVCDVGLTFNRFLCSNCENVEYCDAEQQKRIMGDDYMEIDEQELCNILKQVKQLLFLL